MTIGATAFSESPLDTLISLAVNPPVLGNGDGVFRCSYYGNDYGAQNPSIPVYVPCGSNSAYQSADGWNYFTNIIENLFDISVYSNDTLMGIASVAQANTCANDTAIISVTPKTGYRFVAWNDGKTTNPRTITVMSDTAFTAIFGLQGMFYVLVMVNEPTMGSISGNGDYAANTNAVISATANTGYRFVKWTDGITDNPRTITVISDTSFTAEFEPSPLYHLTLSVNNTNMGTVTGDGDYLENTAVTIEAITNTGYRFVKWNDDITQNPRTVIVLSDTSFTAEFEVEIGITDLETSTITIYPNPTREYIHIILPENVSNAVFTIYDMQGKALIQQNINNQDVVSVSNLAAGIYIYSVRTDKEKHEGKLIINK
jgi:hypothetical protein